MTNHDAKTWMADDWGPFPELAALLSGGDERWQIGPDLWWTFAEESGGLWGLSAEDLWPDCLQRPHSRPEPVVRPRQRAAPPAKRRWRRRRRPEPVEFVPYVPPDLSRMRPLLMDCHNWVSRTILTHVAALFTPPLTDVPIGLCRFSEKALAWTLACCSLGVHGPGAFRKGVVPARYRLTPEDPLADFLVLHMHIEHLVADLMPRLGIPGVPAQGMTRMPGGMRRAAFLLTYPRLAAGASGELQAWRNAMNHLVSESPLTQVIYMDTVDRIPGFESLRRLLCPGHDVAPWHEVWISQIARSLLGAILGPAPVDEACREAEADIERLTLEMKCPKRHSYFFGLFHQVQHVSNAGLRMAQDRLRGLRTLAHQQRLNRVDHLATLFERQPGDLGTVCVHLRLLDMLARTIVSRTAKGLREQWRAHDKPKFMNHARDFLFQESSFRPENPRGTHGLGYVELVRILFDGTVEELNLLADNARADRVVSFLRPDVDVSPAASPTLAAAAGIGRDRAEDLLRRFADEDNWAVDLPCSYPEDRGYAPARMLADCSLSMDKRLRRAEAQQTARQVQVGETAVPEAGAAGDADAADSGENQ